MRKKRVGRKEVRGDIWESAKGLGYKASVDLLWKGRKV
jgi:hypothetical protein